MQLSHAAGGVAELAFVPPPRATRTPRSLPGCGPALTVSWPGRRFGDRYRADGLVGRVGGALVWRGSDEVLSRAVTIWALPPGRPVPVEVIAAVLAAAKLCDPRIARIFDADCATDRPYVISEWAPGTCLDDLLAAGPPNPWTAAAIALTAAGAIADAHSVGPQHLCLTPRSVRWSLNGLKITGLGIEAALSGMTAADPAAADTRSLGALLYALLTGYWPGDGVSRLPRAPMRDGTLCPPAQVRTGVPAALDAIALRALGSEPGRADPSDQIRTPGALARELRAARSEMDLRCSPALTRPSRSLRGSRRAHRAGLGCAGSASAAPSRR